MLKSNYDPQSAIQHVLLRKENERRIICGGKSWFLISEDDKQAESSQLAELHCVTSSMAGADWDLMTSRLTESVLQNIIPSWPDCLAQS